MTNKEKWLGGAGDAYYQRNCADFGQGNDLVWPLIERFQLMGGTALEVGCADGWRLEKLAQERNFLVAGIEPSLEAVNAAAGRKLPGKGVVRGTGDDLSRFADEEFTLVIMGFCMWFIEPELWFKVVAESDRVLANGGVLIVHDFCTSRPIRWGTWNTEATEIERQTVAFGYDFPKLWLGHPWYRVIAEQPGQRPLGKFYNLEIAAALLKDPRTVLGAVDT